MVKIKLCGLCEPTHFEVAWELGVKYVGLVFVEKSPRSISIDYARSILENVPQGLVKVGLLVNPKNDFIQKIASLNLNMIQLHGSETVERVHEIRRTTGMEIIKAVGLNRKEDLKGIYKYSQVADQVLIDAKPSSNKDLPGGNGLKFDWKLIKNNTWKFPWFLAGGLNEGNLLEALKETNAKQVDVSSGIEDKNGRKDVNKIIGFVEKVKEYKGF
ncbi:MAG: phosphoribosylanthranilate isomerase [Paracoccaceae bacterium]